MIESAVNEVNMILMNINEWLSVSEFYELELMIKSAWVNRIMN
jgi:hypothetical protein